MPTLSNDAFSLTTEPGGRAGASFAGEIVFEDVIYRAGQVSVLQGVSLTFPAGKVSCLLGPSGCGKTTVLRLAAGIARPTQGRILQDGQEVAGPQRFVPPEMRNIGLMFQDYALFPHLTVLQNVAFGLTALSADEARRAALVALERVGMAAFANRHPNRLSGGEQQRVALARAFVPRPQVILMDEPFSGLDQRLREQVRSETLAVVRETRSTAVLVTHDPHEALEFGDHVFLMRHGRIVQEGPPRALYGNPTDSSAAQFFAAHNAFEGRVAGGSVDTPIGRIETQGFPEGCDVEILIKPEAVVPSGTGTGAEGYVMAVRFLGESQRLSLVFPGFDRIVTAVVPNTMMFEKGQSAWFTTKSFGVHIFKKP
jgi:iron(III) transport system ATP-binding protein